MPDTELAILMQVYIPGRHGLLLALLGVVLGPVMMWNCVKAIRDREGDFDRELAPAVFYGAIAGFIAAALITLGAGYWLVQWLPEYLFW